MPKPTLWTSTSRTLAPQRAWIGLTLLTALSCSQADTLPAKGDPEQTSQATTSTEPEQSSAPEASVETAPSDPQLQACEDAPGITRCVWAAPPGWKGPILPQAASTQKALSACTSPQGLDKNKPYISKFKQSPGSCKGCEVQLDLGTCSEARLVRKNVKPDAPSECADMVDEDPGPLVTDTCLALPGRGARAGELAIGIRPGTPSQNEATCKVSQEATLDQGGIEAQEFQRICAGQRLEDAFCPNQRRCLAFDVRPAKDAPILDKICIFKEGEHECPKLNYNRRTLVYQGIDDQRSCEPCQAEHEKGELSCDYLFGLSSRDFSRSCSDPTSIEADELCLTEEDLLGRLAPWSIIETERKVRYSGQCKANKPKVLGKAFFKKTLTLCCREAWDE